MRTILKRWQMAALAGVWVIGTTLPAQAAEEAAKASPLSQINSGDVAWMLVASALVMLMTPGLAFFYGGLVRRKNILSVVMQCFMILCLVSLQWIFCGYSLSFGPDIGGVIGGAGGGLGKGERCRPQQGRDQQDQLQEATHRHSPYAAGLAGSLHGD